MKNSVKKIISMMLVACMVLTFALSASAAFEGFGGSLFRALSYSNIFSAEKSGTDANVRPENINDRTFDAVGFAKIFSLKNQNGEEEETESGDRPASSIYKRVVVLGVDGGGTFFKDTPTPNIDRIFANGAITYEAITSTPSISAQCWGSLLHGVTPEFHMLTNSVSSPYPMDSLFPSYFRVVRDAFPDAELASFNNWSVINTGIIEDEIGVYKDNASDDAKVTELVLNYLDDHDPTLLFVHFDSCDGAGHSSGYGSEKHLKQVSTVDGYIGQIYDKMAEKKLLDDTLFIVVPDHGGTPGGSHGGDSEAEMKIMVAIAGKTVQKGTIGEMAIRDIASIVVYALNLEQPETWTSRVPSGVFKGVEAGERPVYEFPENIRYKNQGQPTPLKDSGKYITDFFSAEEIIGYITLDGETKVDVGDYDAEQREKLYYVDGYYGQAASMDDGYVKLRYIPNSDSFSVSLWLNTRGIGGDPAIVSNKNWNDGRTQGFVLSLRTSDIKFNLGNGNARMDAEFPLPSDYQNGWTHVILIVDRENNVVKLSYDFGEPISVEIPDSLKSCSFNGVTNSINFGQDGTGSYEPLPATLDDIIVFDKALTADDIAALKEYYQAER